MKDSKTENWF